MKSFFRKGMVAVLTAAALLLGVAGDSFAAGATKAEAVKRQLTFAVNDFAGGDLDPMVAKSEGTGLLAGMFEGLWEVGRDGKVAPGIIRKWQLSSDRLTWTLYLRNDVIFHDGSKCTARDIAFSMGYYQREEAYRGGYWRDVLGNPPNTKIIDDYTLQVKTSKPVPNLPAFATIVHVPRMCVVPKAYIEKNGVEYFRAHPIGTGAYKFIRYVPGDLMEFDAVDYKHWSGVVPEFKRITILQIPEETTRVYMLKKGTIDVTPVGLEAAAALKRDGFKSISGLFGGTHFNFAGVYLPQAKDSPLSDVRVRQALSLAIDRKEIVNALLGGLGSVPTAPPRMSYDNPGWTPELVNKWKPWFEKNYRYDPQEAKRLIKEAGYPKGFTFDFWVAPDQSAPYLAELATACAAYWKAVGIDAVIVPVDANTWRANRHLSQSLKLAGMGGAAASGVNMPVQIDAAGYFTSKFGSMNLLMGSPLEAKVDALYQEGLACSDPARYAKILDEMVEITAGSWTGFHITLAPSTVVIGPRVDGHITPGAAVPVQNFATWKYTGPK